MSVLEMIAVDLGASSGKVIHGKYDGRRIFVEPLNQFDNIPVRIHDTLYWDILSIYREILGGFRAARGKRIASIGVDSWGNSFGFIDRNEALISNPVHYRDDRTIGMMEKVFEIVPRESVYRQTGIQFNNQW